MYRTAEGRTRPRGRTVLWLAMALVALLAVPATAAAINDYGLTYIGSARCLQSGCHGRTTGRWQVGSYLNTAHSKFVTNISTNTAALVPAASSTTYWPSATYGTTSLRFAPADLTYMIGGPGEEHRYISKFQNSGLITLSTGSTFTAISGPADDWLYFNRRFDPETNRWTSDNPGPRIFFQRCGACHFTGVTRPLFEEYTLGNGTIVDHSTETSFSEGGISCESCHATGKTDTTEPHMETGVEIMRARDVLVSDTCGQCHVAGSSIETDYAGTGKYSSPNGFTPNWKLTDFMTVRGTQYVRATSTSTVSIPETDTYFYPSGHYEAGGHGDSIYNEWMVSGHAQSLRSRATGQLFISRLRDSCLPCHSGEGFLQSIGYDADKNNDVGLHQSSTASDTLNIECGVCHKVHAQSDEPLGLRLEGDDLCGSCHTAGLAEGEELPLGSKTHYSDKEMRAGYGLIGVDEPEAWMGETQCPECHMPTPGGQRSHRMKPMLPGDAEEWEVDEGGDSCTPCHPSSTRAELQAKLDDWAAGVSVASADASAAIADATSNAASATAPGSTLLSAAKTNLTFVAADSSNGAHNYPYAMAGLEKATHFAKSVGGSFTQFGVTPYNSAMGCSAVYGTLEYGDGDPVAGAQVSVQRRLAGTTWSDYIVLTTSDNGAFGGAVMPVDSHAGFGTTEFRVVFDTGLQDIAFTSSTAKVAFSTKTTLRSSRSRFALGGSATVSGAVSPNHTGLPVVVKIKKGSGSWTTLTSKTLGSTSAYSFTWKPRSRGTYYLRTYFAGDASHTGSSSSVITVKAY